MHGLDPDEALRAALRVKPEDVKELKKPKKRKRPKKGQGREDNR